MSAHRAWILISLTSLGLSLAACGKGQSFIGEEGATRGDDRALIPVQDDPSLILPGASKRLFDNIAWSDVGYLFGVDPSLIPYPDTYWPYTNGGSDWNWSQTGSP